MSAMAAWSAGHGQKRSWESGPGQAFTGAQAPPKLVVKYAGADQVPSDNLYLQGLPNSIDVPALEQIFVGCGFTVQRSKVIPDTKGWGSCAAMVQVASQDEAAAAIGVLNGEVVAIAEDPAGEQSQGLASPGAVLEGNLTVKYKGKEQTPSDELYVTGLPTSLRKPDFDAIFTSLGLTVTWSKVIPDTLGLGSCAGMVQVGSVEEAAAAIVALNGQPLQFEGAPAGRSGSGAHGSVSKGKGVLVSPPNGKGHAADQGTGVISVSFAGKEETPSDNLYISGLPASINQDVLNNMILELGFTVRRSKLISDTKGYGTCVAMVQVGSVEEAKSAIETLNGWPIEFEVPETPQAPPVVGKGAAGGKAPPGTLFVKYKGKEQTPSDNLYVSGLPASIDEAGLNEIFTGCGFTVTWSKIIADVKGTGFCVGMVQLGSLEEAASAIEMLHGRPLQYDENTAKGDVRSRQPDNHGKGPVQPAHQKTGGFENPPAYQGAAQSGGSFQKPPALANMLGAGPGLKQGWGQAETRRWGQAEGQRWGQAEDKGWGQAAGQGLGKGWGQAEGKVWGQGVGAQSGQKSGWSSGAKADTAGGKAWAAGGKPLPTPGKLSVRYKGKEQVPSDELYITGLPSGIQEVALVGMFTELGVTVTWSKVMADTKGLGVCTAMVQLGSQDEAALAIQQLDGQTLEVEGGPGRSVQAPSHGPSGWSAAPGVLGVKFKGHDQTPSDNLYVTGLPASLDEAGLNEMFSNLGLNVQRSRVFPDTKGYGVVTAMVQLASVEEATAAIGSLDGQSIEFESAGKGEKSTAPPAAKAKGKGAAHEGNGGASTASTLSVTFKGKEQTPSDNLYISGLPASVEEAQLIDMFTGCGFTVTWSKIMQDRKGTGLCVAMVQLGSLEEAQSAIETLNGLSVEL